MLGFKPDPPRHGRRSSVGRSQLGASSVVSAKVPTLDRRLGRGDVEECEVVAWDTRREDADWADDGICRWVFCM